MKVKNVNTVVYMFIHVYNEHPLNKYNVTGHKKSYITSEKNKFL